MEEDWGKGGMMRGGGGRRGDMWRKERGAWEEEEGDSRMRERRWWIGSGEG